MPGRWPGWNQGGGFWLDASVGIGKVEVPGGALAVANALFALAGKPNTFARHPWRMRDRADGAPQTQDESSFESSWSSISALPSVSSSAKDFGDASSFA